MPATQPVPGHSLEIRRTNATAPEKAFDAWTKPEKMSRWFCRASETHKLKIHEVDLLVGGRPWADMVSPEGKVWKLRGEYREIKPAEKLVFTWSRVNEPQHGEPS